MRRIGRVLFALVMMIGLLSQAVPALAHDHRDFYLDREHDALWKPIGKIAGTRPDAVAASSSFVAPAAGKPQSQTVKTVLTRNPDTPILLEPGFETPSDECSAPSCSEIIVEVPQGASPTTLYARASWALPSYYVHIWGISPDGQTVVGKSNVAQSFEKETGNERTIPVAEFHVPNPAAGAWRIQTRAVFGHQVPVTTTVALAAGKPVAYERLGVRELADKYLTQSLAVNVVFAGRDWSKEEVAEFRSHMPLEYRPAVLQKQASDCTGDGDQLQDPLLNWRICHYSGTASPDATGSRPYFEPIHFKYSYSFLEADETWTRDLFAKAKSVTTEDAPFDQPIAPPGTKMSAGQYLTLYDAHQGKRTRDVAHQVTDPTVSDKIDAFEVEDWIFQSRMNPKYARSFTDLEKGSVRDARFIGPDPSGVYDPFYNASGTTDLERMPQGPATTFTFFVFDTYSAPYADEYFRPNAYHHWDVSERMIDPDTNTQDGPDWARVWGGRYRFFFHDIGAGPNHYEAVDFFLGRVPGSAAKPHGDPPIWDYENDPDWQGLLVERTARSMVTMLLFRFTPSYLYRPLPADVYFLASNNWSDCYSRPECSPDGVSHTVLEKIYQPSYVEKNLGAALPGATFLTERSDPALETYRYLGCASNRAISNREGEEPVLVPDPNCVGKESDPIQEWLELAKARGDDLVGLGVNDFGTSGFVVRRLVEQNRDMIAPLRPGQQTLTNISVVFPGATTWFLPAIVGGVALPTPNSEIWGILNNVNDRSKAAAATDCSKSLPAAPGCGVVPDTGGGGFSYTVQHEASHFLGLLHPHDSLTVEQDSTGKWQYYGSSYRHYGDSSMAPTTYAGAFAPYSVLDQDIIQRGHAAEYLRMTEDSIADAYLQDGMNGLSGPSAITQRKQKEAGRWKTAAAQLFSCGDYLQAERAMRNAYLAAQGTFGPIVAPRGLKPGERVLFRISGQRAFGSTGAQIAGCGASVAGAKVIGGKTTTPSGDPLPATGIGDGVYVGVLFMATAGALLRWRRRIA